MVSISVIIPIFNMGQYIGNAIESLIKQSLKNLEIICIDDGSTDNSLEVLKTYDYLPNIKIISIENSGSGVARNIGISNATGKYVCFLDADDNYASDDALEILYNKAEETGALICGGSSYNVIDGICIKERLRKGRRVDIEGFIEKENMPTQIGYWAYIFNLDFLKLNRILFPDYRRGQDLVFFANAIARAGKVYRIKKDIYAYRKEHKVVKFDRQKAVDLLKAHRDVLYISKENGMKQIYRSEISEFSWGELEALLYEFTTDNDEEMQDLATSINYAIDPEIVPGVKKIVLEGKEIKDYKDNVDTNKKQFLDMLKRYKRVYIFGAGAIGCKAEAFLKNNCCNIDAFLVSKMDENRSKYDGVDILNIKNMEIGLADLVIVATFPYLHDEITKLLKQKDVNNIYYLNVRDLLFWSGKFEY